MAMDGNKGNDGNGAQQQQWWRPDKQWLSPRHAHTTTTCERNTQNKIEMPYKNNVRTKNAKETKMPVPCKNNVRTMNTK